MGFFLTSKNVHLHAVHPIVLRLAFCAYYNGTAQSRNVRQQRTLDPGCLINQISAALTPRLRTILSVLGKSAVPGPCANTPHSCYSCHAGLTPHHSQAAMQIA